MLEAHAARRRGVLSLIALLLLTLGQPAIAPAPLAVGTTSLGADDSGSCAGTLTADRAIRATVTAPNTEAITADLCVYEPTGGANASVGTVLLYSGGGACGSWAAQGATASAMIGALQAANYRAIEVRWRTQAGASTCGWNVNLAGTGVTAAAGRFATLHHGTGGIYSTSSLRRAGTPLCPVGQSGGGHGGIYDLTRYGGASYLALVVAGGGPALGRIDWHCEGRRNWSWSAVCDTRQVSGTGGPCVGIPSFVDDAYGRNTASGACAFGANSGALPWHEDSIVSPSASWVYASTKVRFFFGGTDTMDVAVPLGRLVYDQMLAHNGASRVSETVVASTPHVVASTSAGATAILSAITTDCVGTWN